MTPSWLIDCSTLPGPACRDPRPNQRERSPGNGLCPKPPVRSVQPPVQLVQLVQPVQSVQPVQPVQPVQSVQSVQLEVQLVQPVQPWVQPVQLWVQLSEQFQASSSLIPCANGSAPAVTL